MSGNVYLYSWTIVFWFFLSCWSRSLTTKLLWSRCCRQREGYYLIISVGPLLVCTVTLITKSRTAEQVHLCLRPTPLFWASLLRPYGQCRPTGPSWRADRQSHLNLPESASLMKKQFLLFFSMKKGEKYQDRNEKDRKDSNRLTVKSWSGRLVLVAVGANVVISSARPMTPVDTH